MKIVIVGGVAGGATAAARIRRLDEKAEIIIFERSGFISYANCGLPYYIGGIITESNSLTLQTPDSFRNRFNIDVRVRHEVTSIDTENKTVSVRGLDTDVTYEETYDKLLLSPGAEPTRKPLNDGNAEKESRVFSLRTVEDTMKISGFLENRNPKSVVIAGGGYIGLETAENLFEKGLDVTIVQSRDHLIASLDADMASLVHSKVRSRGIHLYLNNKVGDYEVADGVVKTQISSGETLTSDMLILSLGVTPDTHLAKEAGLETGKKGSIVVNERMETSVKDIFAVGDAIEVKNYISGEKTLISLAGPANKQARIAADNICGGDSVFRGSQGTSVIKVFNMTVATTGLNEMSAERAGFDYDKIIISPSSHASYYPDSKVMTIKVIYEKGSLKLLGAQIVGKSGVDKRIDVIATAMRAGLTALQLKELDLAYAPPYSSAKDPVNMVGFVIENIATGKIKQFHWNEIGSLPHDGSVTLLDTRTKIEYKGGHAEGFINIPVDELRNNIDMIPEGKPVYIMCQSGVRSYIACRILAQSQFDCFNFSGGYRFYESVVLDKMASSEAFPCGIEKN